MNVVSVSRRTDIPALYWPWFRGRLEAGYCHVVNPFNARQVYRVSLLPQDVIAFVFWTRFAGSLVRDAAVLAQRGYSFVVLHTLTGYPPLLEPNAPRFETAVRTLVELSAATSPERVVWRYDPIILSTRTPAAYHVERFAEIAGRLAGAVRRVIISFYDTYEHSQRRLARLTRATDVSFAPGTLAQRASLARQLAQIASAHGMSLATCAEPELAQAGLEPGRCVDPALLQSVRPDLELHLRRAPTRAGCGCAESVDIGAYDTCTFACAYCYAVRSAPRATLRHREHDPHDSLLWRPPDLRGVDLDDPSVESVDRVPRAAPARRSMT